MGTHTGTLLAVLLTLLNVRLGYWLENPSKLGPKRTQPRTLPPLWYFVKDMFGAAGGNDDYVSVSDGGHFDNSGIYELVRRRCRYVVFVDSAGEASPANVLFDTVGNAARLVRIDFGVDIEIDLGPVTPDPRTGRTPANFAIGKIIYPRSNRPGMTSAQVDADREGVFILLRSTLTDDPPVPDLEAYRRINSSFPSDPTTRLFFDEAQFEAYRALGYNIGREAFRGHFPPTQDDATCFRNMTNSHAQTGRNVAPVTERGSISPAVAGAFR